MKKLIIISLTIISSLNGMEKQIITREPRERDAQAYEEGNRLQTDSFFYFLKKNNIETINKTILDVGCRSGNIAAKLAENAAYIHGFDASTNMIDFAQKKYGPVLKNVSFTHCFPEDFIAKEKYQLAIAVFSLPTIDDKKQTFHNINNSLEMDGEFFGIIKTTNNPQPIHFALFNEMMPFIKQYVPSTTPQTSNPLGTSYISTQEYTNILQETGFEIIRNEEQSFECIMNKDELRKFQWPIFSARPIIQSIPHKEQELLFEEFMNRYLQALPKINDEQFLNKLIINIVHARKVKK